MNRRSVLKNLVIGYGGLITLPFWMEAYGISDQNTHNSSFTLSEQDMDASLRIQEIM